MVTQTPIAPGARIVVRDEEWLVRRVDPASDGGRLLTCDGVSDLVRGQASLFLTALEGPIAVLDPAETQLVADPSPMFNAALLCLESQRRRTMPNDAKMHLGHRAVMDLEPYQLEPALQALRQPRSRILIADAVGLGKTLEAGILATELIQRGRGKRILVVTLKSMLTQFQKEWWSRFSMPLVRLDALGLARVRHRIPSNHNPFNTPAQVSATLDAQQANMQAHEGDWLLQLFGGGAAAAPATAQPLAPQSSDHIEAWPGLFKDEYDFARAALTQLAPARDWLQWSANDAAQGLAITAPPDLQERLQQLPREVRGSNNRYELCADPARLRRAHR